MQTYLRVFEGSYISTPCPKCSKPMSAEEAFHYDTCEQCTNEDWHELKAWKSGAENKDLDEKFSPPKKAIH